MTPTASVEGVLTESDADAITRRRFVGLIAAGAAGALAVPALVDAAASRHHTTPAPPPSAKVAKGLAEQKDSLAKTLKTIREFDLPPGSEQGFAFRPLPARRS